MYMFNAKCLMQNPEVQDVERRMLDALNVGRWTLDLPNVGRWTLDLPNVGHWTLNMLNVGCSTTLDMLTLGAGRWKQCWRRPEASNNGGAAAD
ncbi:hypothetical protein PUN28_009630 [Cardiocondyla obscurior]|uniref:Uncharacterized protein n=1 Tax=Cardiocondyla obscurior TaxID=286306 RepID=A0AAW2FUU1_9HYME